MRINLLLLLTEKNVRDKALKSLTLYLVKKKDWSDLDLDKIWKALFYCTLNKNDIASGGYELLIWKYVGMWMSDKMKIQQELAENLALLIHKFPVVELKIRFIHSFFKTIHREWHGIDGLRLDKFYSLIRRFVHQSFVLLQEQGWTMDLVEKFASIISSEILSKLPNGLRIHICDLYLKEIYEAVGKSVC